MGDRMRAHVLLLLFVMMIVACASAASRVAVFAGDDAFVRMEYGRAVKQYDSVMQVVAPHADLFWRLARVHIAMGDVAEGDVRAAHYRQAVQCARHSVALDSTNADGYAWLAAALGSAAIDAGSKEKVRLANEIKRCLDRAVALDPGNDVAWSILGTFYRSLGGVSWIERQLANLLLGSLPEGGYHDAEDALRKAIAIAPGIVRHRYELAMLYEAMDRPEDAAVEYRTCTGLPPQMLSDLHRKADAAKWLEKNRDVAGAGE
jgi:tetratricopeptide (TPR) repeat protein